MGYGAEKTMSPQRVVITGAGAVSPLGRGWDALWQGLLSGRTAVARCPSLSNVKGLRTTVAAFVPSADGSAIERKKRRYMSDMSIYATLAARDAVEMAGLTEDQIRSPETGVCLGSTTGSTIETENFFREMLPARSIEQLKSTHFFKIMNSSCAANVAQALGTCGRCMAPSAACATGTIAVGMAAETIAFGKQEVMICGGADELHPLTVGVFDTLEASSRAYNDHPDATPRPFDKDRDGIICGEGAGVVVLESLAHAQARRAPILGEITGFSMNSSPEAIANPSVKSLVRCMTTALRDAGLDASSVAYVNAHATGTVQGDEAECRAVEEVFGRAVPVSSLKGHLGHTMAACGALELIATLCMMRESMLIPTRNLACPDPVCARVNLLTQPLCAAVDTAIINSFALGGINSAMVIHRSTMHDG